MFSATVDYFRRLMEAFGQGWNRFWFLPSDPYPLGVIRALTGLVALWLHATLWPELVRLFAAGGWLPVDVIAKTTVRGYPLSYLNFFHSPADLAVVHGLGLAVLLAFTLGFWSRLSSILALLVMLSDVHRAPLLTTQVEPIVTLVMFYLCLGPSGASWSLDRVLAERRAAAGGALLAPPRHTFMTTVSLRLLQVHLAMLYATFGAAKLMGDTWWRGMGTWWLMTRPESRWIDLTWLPTFAVNFWTHAIVAFELGFAILIWIPLARPLLLGLAVAMWSLTALITGQVEFALMMLIANLCFCSPDWLRSATGGVTRRGATTAAA